MADDSRVVAGRASERTTVTGLLLDVADDSTLRQLRDREDVADRKLGLLAAVDEGTGVEALSGNESLLAELVAVGVTEDNAGERSATTSVVNNFFYNSTDVSIALRVVKVAEFCRGLVVVGVRFELKKFVNKSQDIHNNA